METSEMDLKTASSSIEERLEKLEERNSDSEVKDALKSIDVFRLRLSEELGKMYRTNIDQISQAAKALGDWHGHFRADVNKIWDERNGELHTAREQIFRRLETLEQSDTVAVLSDQRQRIHLLEASAKLFIDKNKFNDLAARMRRLEERSHVDQRRESTRSRRVSRLDCRHEDIAAAECEIRQLRTIETKHEEKSRARDIALQQSVKQVETSVVDLRKRMDVISSSTGPSAPMPSKCRNLASEVNALHRRLDESDTSSQSNFRILSDRIRNQHLRKTSSVPRLTTEFTPNASDSGAAMTEHLALLPRKADQDRALDRRLDKMAAALDEGLKHHVQFSAEIKAGISRLAEWTSLLETSTASQTVPGELGEVRRRIDSVEASRPVADLDSRVTALSNQVTHLTELSEDESLRRRIEMLSQRMTEFEDRPKQTEQNNGESCRIAVTNHEDILQRIANVEEHARTSAEHHNTNRSDHDELRKRLQIIEGIATRKSVEAALKVVEDRIGTIGGRTSEAAIQNIVKQHIDSVSVRGVVSLADTSSRITALEAGLKSFRNNSEQHLLMTRVEMLEKTAIGAALDRRFESLAETLATMREHIAADKSPERIESVLQRLARVDEVVNEVQTKLAEQSVAEINARVSRLQDDLQNVQVARGVRGQVIDDLIKRADETATTVAQCEKSTDKLAHEADSLAGGHKDLKEELLNLQESSEDLRSWIGRIGEKSQRDNQAIHGRMQVQDREQKLRLAFAEDGIDRLRDEVRNLRSLGFDARPRRQLSLADDIDCVRVRIGGKRLDDVAYEKLSKLVEAVKALEAAPDGPEM